MELHKLRKDFFLDFSGFHGAASKCHIRILKEDKKPIVVICSQLPQSYGTSVQNAYEIIKNDVFQKLKDLGLSKKDNLVWVEHWPEGTGLLTEESDYYMVKETKSGEPTWNRVSTSWLSKELGYPIYDIEIPITLLSGISKQDIEKSVYDWKYRLDDLFKSIEDYVDTDNVLSIKDGPPVYMHEELMQKFEVPSIKLRSLDVYRKNKLIASIKPVGLWVIGANGRVDILTKNGSYILVDRAKKFETPKWTIYSSNHRKVGISLDIDGFFKELK